MMMRDGYEWIPEGQNEWSVYTRDRKIAWLKKDEKGYFIGESTDRFEADVLLRLIERGTRNGFTG